MAKLIRKISTKTLGFNQSGIRKLTDAGKPVILYNLIGKINKTREGEGTYGMFCALKGDCLAVIVTGNDTFDAGEQIQAPQCFLAEPLSSMIQNALAENPDSGVEFACRVIAKKDDSSATGYVYDIEPVVKLQEANPLAHLLEKFDTPKALENKAESKPKAK